MVVYKEVAVIIPYVNDKVLLQLRDIKEEIDFPGYWGFFGGSIDPGETPERTARRELFEEIGYRPAVMKELSTERKPDLGNLVSHSFYCPLTVSPGELVLREGLDLGLFSLEQVRAMQLYSQRLNKLFPVVSNRYIIATLEKLFEVLDGQRKDGQPESGKARWCEALVGAWSKSK